MNQYKAYGLVIDCDVELPLPTEKGQDPDIVIESRPFGVRKISTTSSGRKNDETVYVGNEGDLITGRIYDELCYVVKDGRNLFYKLFKSLPQGVLQSYLLGVLMATLLRQRGFLVLHACSVAKDGKAMAFVGESGWGKSTLAEYFCQRGYTLLSDDVLAIRIEKGKHPQVIPGYPQIRLRAEAGRHLRTDFDQLPVVNEETTKRFTKPDRFPDRPLPLHKLYLLDPRFTTENAVEPVPAQHALLRLIHHTRVTNVIKAPAFQAELFRQCEQLVRRVPIGRLRRVKDLGRLCEIRELVEQDLLEERSAGTAPVAETCKAA